MKINDCRPSTANALDKNTRNPRSVDNTYLLTIRNCAALAANVGKINVDGGFRVPGTQHALISEKLVIDAAEVMLGIATENFAL